MGLHTLMASFILAGIAIFAPSETTKIDMTYARGGPANAVLFAKGGSLISFCPQLACVVSPTIDHQRATALFAATTSDDGHSEEQTVAIETTIKTGRARKWLPMTPYTLGDNVNFGGTTNSVYRAVNAGISARSGAGPIGKGQDIVDGTVRWKWINDAAIAAKVGLYNEAAIYAGGGASWGQANNVHLMPGATPSFNVNTEFDFVNEASDCQIGSTNCINLVVTSAGPHQSTANLYVDSENTDHYAVHWGIRIAGRYLASEEDLEDDADAPVGIGLGLFGQSSHSRAAIEDRSTGPVSYLITGDHTEAAIADNSTSPTTLDVKGKHRIAGVLERSESQNGIELAGKYTGAQIVGKGFRVAPDGAVTSASIEASKRLIVPVATPATSSSPCSKGQIQFDNAYIYTCVAPHSWRRARAEQF